MSLDTHYKVTWPDNLLKVAPQASDHNVSLLHDERDICEQLHTQSALLMPLSSLLASVLASFYVFHSTRYISAINKSISEYILLFCLCEKKYTSVAI